MQNRSSKKIIVDEVKLKTLLRLGCPNQAIFEKIVNDKFIKQNDELIDMLLESLTDRKDFKNWGGKRENSGRKLKVFKTKKNQDENQLENQDANQVVDKDKDKDIDKDIDKIKIKLKDILFKHYNRDFNTNKWSYYIKNMICIDKINVEDILKSLDWYSLHIGEDYIPVIQCGKSLREKYNKLENAIKREENKNKPDDDYNPYIPEKRSLW